MLWPTGRAALVLMLLCGLSTTVWANPLDAIDSLQVRTGALFLDRIDSGGDNGIVRGTSAQPLLSASQINPGGDVGWELSLIGRLRDEFALEARFFALDSFDSHTRLSRNPDGLGFDIDDSVLGMFSSGSPVVGDFNYETELYSIELNERWRILQDVDFLLGLRHVQNKETLSGLFADASSQNAMQFEADNFLSGVQIGLDACLWQRGRFHVEGLAKVGAYHNIVRTRYALEYDTGSTTIREWTSDNKNAFSLLGELQLTGVYQVCDRIALRGGYQFLFMTDIATAPSQVAGTRTALNGGPTQMRAVAGDALLLHGLTAQIEIWLY